MNETLIIAVKLALQMEQAVNEMAALSGRKHCARHINRLARFSNARTVSFQAVWSEWKARAIQGMWGQRGRLRRLGMPV